ncbi:hypothetical protein F1847_07630 [Thermodesulfobacterium sp. TA1]|uniref:hypothetical protein n=1 Tax=Thermodesulfobacterium sp. TA1 TaxID=2234087 RepID=UPI001232CACC|nr:hypothetical protein [Thermodesulfobacterium sp. TA1]QER42615.1 hypothetical protein F1847_07630 [Thermodesulfobacterium sp. TA1]
MIKKESVWIIKPLKEDFFEGFKFDRQFKKFEFLPKIELSQIKKQKVYLILEPQIFFADYIEIPGKISEFIKVQAENRVKESGIFLSPPKTIYKVTETLEMSSKVFVFGIEEKLINNYLEKLRNVQARVEIITHKILSIFCWFQKQLYSESISLPVLLVILDPNEVWYLVVYQKAPLYIKFSVLDEFIGISTQIISENILSLKDYVYKFFQEDIKGLFFLGKERNKINQEEIAEKTKLSLIDLNLKTFEEAYSYPEIFGAITLDQNFNFLPNLEKLFLTQINWIEKLTPVILGLTGINILLCLYFYKINSDLEKKIEAEILNTNKVISEIAYKIPESSLPKIKTYLSLEKEKTTSLKLDEFLLWLSQIWNENLILKNLKVDKNNKIFIEVEIKGDMITTQKRTDELINHFKKHFKIEKSNLHFFGRENKGILNLEADLIR